MEGMQYLDLIHTHSALFYFAINRMMGVKIFIGVISMIGITMSLLVLLHPSAKREEVKYMLRVLGISLLILIGATLIPTPDTLRHVVAVSLMDPISVFDLESYKEAVSTIEQFIKETY
jgi:hypothetical protein